MTRAWGLIAAVVLAIAMPACGPDAPPPAPPKKELTAAWADIWEGTPDIYAVIRPQAIKRDQLYGTFWKNLVRIAQAKNFAGGASMLEAVEGAEEVIIGINKGDAAMVLRGVPASHDPSKMTDASGHPLFRLVDEKAKVPEYTMFDRRTNEPGSVFVLGNRTWVGVLGESRSRARQVFASPLGRAVPEVDGEALAYVRFGTPVVTAPFFQKHPTCGPFTRRLVSVSFALKPNKAGALIALQYKDNDGAAWGEMHAKKLVEELSKNERLAWLKDAKVAYDNDVVNVRVAVPARLLEELPNASGADFGF